MSCCTKTCKGGLFRSCIISLLALSCHSNVLTASEILFKAVNDSRLLSWKDFSTIRCSLSSISHLAPLTIEVTFRQKDFELYEESYL